MYGVSLIGFQDWSSESTQCLSVCWRVRISSNPRCWKLQSKGNQGHSASLKLRPASSPECNWGKPALKSWRNQNLISIGNSSSSSKRHTCLSRMELQKMQQTSSFSLFSPTCATRPLDQPAIRAGRKIISRYLQPTSFYKPSIRTRSYRHLHFLGKAGKGLSGKAE